ncbi:MAG: protein kinase [Vicinamibacteria bacterium]|nr:protein kinase [Vicinamibacteria bacterium]
MAQREPAAQLVGTTLGHYRVESRLGAGGMGDVFVAHDRRLDRRVALKVLPAHLAHDASARLRFEAEARAVAALSHPGIVTIHSVEDADGHVFLTMELVSGTTLAERIASGGLPLAQLLAIAGQLVEAVAAAHRAGITHRDLKPHNVMVDATGRVKVLDFGLAKPTATPAPGASEEASTQAVLQTEPGIVMGTVRYMSPEQAQGRDVGPASDVFSLGVVLYEMAAGRRPFEGDSYAAVISAILRDTPPSLLSLRPDLPPAVDRIVSRCLQKDPAARFATAAELAADLAHLPEARRRPSAAFAATAVAALALGVAGAWLWGAARAARPAPALANPTAPSIAVLPLANLGSDPETDYFASGMGEEIAGKLSRIRGLQVAPVGATLHLAEKDGDPRRVGAALGVGTLLAGSVRKSGRRVRISVRLLSAETGYQLWSEDFDGELDDVFRLQEQTALRIAEALDVRLSSDDHDTLRQRSTANPLAYDEYLRGRVLIEHFNDPEKLEAARQHLERALQLDPDFPLALVGLSRVESQYHRNLDPRPERLERAEQLARRALALQPRLTEAQLAMGQVLGNRYDYAGAVERFREATRLEPGSAYAWDLLSWALAYLQPPDARAAEDAARRAIVLQPALIGAHYHLGRALLLQGRFDEATAAFVQCRRMDPTFEAADGGIAQVHLARGSYVEARAALGRMRQRGSPVYLVTEAMVLAGEGDRGGALAALDRALAAGYRDGGALRSSPHLAALRGDPRYVTLLRGRGLEP